MMDPGFKMKRYEEPEKIASQEMLKAQFDNDTAIVAEQTSLFVKSIHPAYLVNTKKETLDLSYQSADILLDAFTFYRLVSCTTETVEDMFEYLNEKMSKFFTATHSLGKPIVYGIISCQGKTNLVIGVYDESDDANTIKSIMEGLLNGIELQTYSPKLSSRKSGEKEVGLISAIPSVKIGDDKQKFDISALLKSLNGQDYTVLFVTRPISQEEVSNKYGEVIQIRDACFAVSKRNISNQQGTSHSVGVTQGYTETDTHSTSTTITKTKSRSGSLGLSFILSANRSKSKSKSTAKTEQDSYSTAENYSKSITDAVNNTEGISADIQNGFALEMIGYADKAIDRLKQGRSNGMWETVISYSANSEAIAGIIKACISGEMAKPNPDILPQISNLYHLEKKEAENNSILIPKIIMGEQELSPLCTALTSEELGLMCTLPSEPVPNFELKKGKMYPLITDNVDGIQLGTICDGQRQLDNMPYTLSNKDLARHTFVCGITGSGKTTTVKGILRNANIPFLVIESAKKEYRNIKLNGDEHPLVYTLGKPEINSLQFNPFYIQCGVSPQTHIDFLKDLFNASFSFYGPMPYILEKCLHNIYRKKGWNLTLGFHPYLVNAENSADLFEAEYMQENYLCESHKFLFPTMQDLKNEIERYIEEDMQYEGEIAGNIKTAIKVRLESLCSGSKGYMFNTYEYADMNKLLNKNVVFELEGLADDSDKAFCVGLLIIFINEYRQITKETTKLENNASHLLVIEEAHRLLKNVDTDRSSENMGNPKGKAVEHFTNMIAEMRSYGQGVIIAEQIPSKLAPDVIKNSSNKIIQRLVAADDQNLVANTIGLSEDDALHIGSLRTGMALCHKEGMSLPVCIKIQQVEEIQVSDGMLYGGDVAGRLHRINYNLVKECVADKVEIQALKILNAVLIQDIESVKESVLWYRKQIKSTLIKRGVDLVLCEDENAIYAGLLNEVILQYLLNGVYSIKHLISNELNYGIQNLLLNPNEKRLEVVKTILKKSYKDDPAYKGKYIISQLVYNQMDSKTDIRNTVKNYFVVPEDKIVVDIWTMIEER